MSDLTQVTTNIETITPEKASELLAANTGNRNLRVAKVSILAGAMRRGEWQFNGDAIRIAEDGTLIDGQHRLSALVEAGHTDQFLVIRGLARQSQETMDQNSKRSVADYLKMRGDVNVHSLAAGMRTLWFYDARGSFVPSQPHPTVQQLLAVKDRQENLTEANKFASRVRASLPLPNSVTVACAALFLDADEDDAHVFFEKLRTGDGLGQGDPIYAARRIFIGQLSAKRKAPAPLTGALIVKSFNAWRAGRQIQNLSWRGGGSASEAFPHVDDRPPKGALAGKKKS